MEQVPGRLAMRRAVRQGVVRRVRRRDRRQCRGRRFRIRRVAGASAASELTFRTGRCPHLDLEWRSDTDSRCGLWPKEAQAVAAAGQRAKNPFMYIFVYYMHIR